ncbi:hypothetical protein E2C01_099687 [Portunus trituberculatus]|uniref:Uncharacterized protein n=1 Tax=Portunus trituberculatus TaxID=210409 RepID=A0A5B7KA92_PORTR|nr:hypothetical protein [Portunus trituberculatus]
MAASVPCSAVWPRLFINLTPMSSIFIWNFCRHQK